MEDTLMKRVSIPQRSPEWYTVRTTLVTGSEAGTVLGLNPFQKPADLILEKLGLVPRFQGNDATRHGQAFEDEAIHLYEQRLQCRVQPFGLLIHPTLHFLGASPDGVVLQSRKAIEVKVRPGLRVWANR